MILRKILTSLQRVEKLLIVVLMIAMVVLYAFNVFIREVFPYYSANFAWIDELARLIMVWNVFLALGVALEKGRHIAVTTLLEKFNASLQRVIKGVINLVGMLFCVYLAKLSFYMSVFVKETGQISPTLGWPVYLLYLAPLFGFSLFALRYFLELIGFNNRYLLHVEGAECNYEGEETR